MNARMVTPRPIPVYWVAVAVATVILSPLLSIVASVQIAENSYDKARARQEELDAAAQQRQRDLSRKTACDFFGAYLATFDETPPTTPAGRNLQSKFEDLYLTAECTPVRK